jgi:uncharacterized protein (TIGR00369 family)
MDLLAIGNNVLESQPFSRLLGTRLTTYSTGNATLELAIRPDMLQQFGFVHGGIISYLADNAITFAGGSVLGANVLTSEYKINYLRPAQGQTLQARASVIHTGKRQAVVRCDVFTLNENNEKICATALGTIITFADKNTENQ